MGIDLLHDQAYSLIIEGGEWLDLGDHWTDEIISQQVAEIKEGENPHIIAAKALAEQAKAMYDAAMNFDNAA